jgi:hypothetical protein
LKRQHLFRFMVSPQKRSDSGDSIGNTYQARRRNTSLYELHNRLNVLIRNQIHVVNHTP